ncbi:MAG: histidine kinase N-terminal 7TM domain-containing protein [Candidatus Promineifilaceae bacterium]
METLQYTPYILPALVSAVICIMLARYAWSRRPRVGSTSFTVLTLAVAIWSLGYVFELSSVTLDVKVFWAKAQYAAIVIVPTAWLALALEYNSLERYLNRRNLLLLSIFPFVTFIVVLTNGFHSLHWQSVALSTSPPFPSLELTYGPWFWLHILYSAALILVGSGLFINYIRNSLLNLYRWQALILLIGVLAPWIANAIHILHASPIHGLDVTPIGFMISSLAIAIGVLRYRLFDILPVDRLAVMESMREGMVVLDLYNRIVDINATATEILQLQLSDVVGNLVTDILPDSGITHQIGLINGGEEMEGEMTVGEGEARRYYEVRLSPLFNRQRKIRGRLLVFHDATRQKTAEAALLAQKLLFENLVSVARATAEGPSLEATLQNALDVAVKLTQAELGSLFVLDENNIVTNSILSRGEMSPLEQQELVGRVMDQGLAGWVVRHQEAVRIQETATDERWITLPDAPYDAQSVLAVPIVSSKTVLGILTLQHSRPKHFSQEDLRLMQASADQMVLALRNARLYDEQLRLAQQQTALYETLRTVGSHLQPGTVVHAAAGTVAALTGWTAVAILVPDDTKTNLIVRAASGILSAVEGIQIPITKSVCGQAFMSGQTRYVPEVTKETNYFLGHDDIKSELAVPIQRGGQMLGILDLESDQPNAFREEDIRLAESLAETIGLALDNAHLFRVIEDERSRLQALIQSSRDGVVLVGMDQRILVMNQPAHELLQLTDTPADWVNRSVMEAMAELFEFAPLAAQATMAGVRHMNQANDPPSEGEIEVPPRTIRWLNLPVRAGDMPIGRLLSLRDVTKERLLEQTREDLTHTMVHDLRNPLNNIYSAQELIPDLGPLNEDQTHIMDVARDSTQRMLVLVNAILDISRLEGGHMPMTLKPVPMQKVAARVVESQLPLANSKDIQLAYQLPADLPQAMADSGLIERVLQNLIGNALKFTPLGGAVLVTAGLDNENENQLFVRVQDTGPGIPVSVQDRLFQKFTTGKQMGSGSGLGLAFCRMVVEAHGGRIWAKSWADEGSAFTFTLPIATIHPPKPAPTSEIEHLTAPGQMKL